MKRRILLLDSNPGNFTQARNLFTDTIGDLFFLDKVEDALSMLSVEPCDMVIINENITSSNSREILKFKSLKKKSWQVIIFSSYGTQQRQKEILSLGASEYLINGQYDESLFRTAKSQLEFIELRERSEKLEELLAEPYSFSNIIGKSEPMKAVFELISKVAPSEANVLIQGESGTGKELVARALHFNSNRRSGGFIAVNCAAIPRDLMESEFFGHIKGAFTGAESNKTGLFEAASGGTILLDEISEIPFDLQSKLLRTIHEREIKPVGSARVLPLNIRLISATNRDLENEVGAGRFREDLFFRLNTIIINLPSLRERKSDIPILVEHFIKQYASKMGKKIASVSREAMRELIEYHWPGNVRELENAVERAVILCDGNEIGADHFILRTGSYKTDETIGFDTDLFNLDYTQARKILSDRFAVEYFKKLLEGENWNISRSARKAGIKRQSLHQIIKRLKLAREKTGERLK